MAEVKKVLLLGQKDYIEKEWKDLNDFQDVYFMEVSFFTQTFKLPSTLDHQRLAYRHSLCTSNIIRT